jgi:hypothetical protein
VSFEIDKFVIEFVIVAAIIAGVTFLAWIFIKHGGPLIDRLIDYFRQDAAKIKKQVADAAANASERAKRMNRTAGESARAAASAWVGKDATRMKKYEQLEKLGALRQAGALTEEEFQAEKARILQENAD